MTAPVLKRSLGDGGAAIDESHGAPSTLRVALASIAKDAGPRLGASNSAPAVATLDTLVATRPGVLQSFRMSMGTTGTAGSTTAELRKNGNAVASLTIANTETDGTQKESTIAPAEQVAAGDVLTIEVTAIPTAGAYLSADAVLQAVEVE
jgi:hypothetical protein